MQESECVKHKNCGDCEYAFERLIGYNYVCDIDAEPIELDQMRQDCPLEIKMSIDRPRLQNLALRKVKREELNQPCVECGHKVLIDFTKEDIARVCKSEPCQFVDVVMVEGGLNG